MDVEREGHQNQQDHHRRRRRCAPRIRAIGELGAAFNLVQVAARCLSVLYEAGALCFVAWLYDYWRSEPTVRVDVLFPSFFPLIVGILLGVYEAVSLLFLDRRRAINPVAVGLDVALTGTGIFCFLILSSVDRGTGVRRGHWFEDMRNAMILMIVFSVVHVSFIILAAGGVISCYSSSTISKKDAQLAQSQAEIVQFNEELRQRTAHPPPALAR